MNSGLWTNVVENAMFVAECIIIVVVLIAIAYAMEKIKNSKEANKEQVLSTRRIVVIGMFSALAAVLMLFEIPMPFAPPFYKLDFSEVPILIGAFAFGPVAGVLMEFIKVLLHILFKGTSTAFVGDLANFAVGCSFILPASCIYYFKKTKTNAIVACVVGTIIITIFGSSFNAVYLVPTFAKLFGMPLEAIIGMGTAITPKITNITTFVIYAVAPLNIIKGTSVSIITLLVYKRISPILKK